jgi:hypothetical protein
MRWLQAILNMEYILLDTNILIEYPLITTIKSDEIQFGITDAVHQLFFEKSIYRKLDQEKYIGAYNYLDYSVNNNLVKLLRTNGRIKHLNLKGYPQLGNAAISLLIKYEELKNEGHKLHIATDNVALQGCCKLNQIPFFNLTEVKEYVKNIKSDSGAFVNLKSQIKKEVQKVRFEIFFAIVITVFSLLLINYFGIVKSTIGNLILIPLILLLGLMLFIFREKYRLSYGIVELILGCTSVIIGVLNYIPSTDKTLVELNIKIFGGLYIMVRGQENILKSIQNLIIGDRILRFLKIQKI